MSGRVRATNPPQPLWRPSEPILWLSAILILFGGVEMTSMFAGAFREYPTGTAFAFGLFAIYTVPFIWFIRQRDLFEPEPIPLLGLAFTWGALVATAGAISGNVAIAGILAKTAGLEFATVWTPAIAGPTTEEVLKTAGIIAIALLAKGAIGSALDGMAYGAMVGLGFQIVENVLYAINAIALSGAENEIDPVVGIFILRGLLSGLWSHAMYSALIGAGIGYALSHHGRSMPRRIAVAAIAFGLGWGLHFLWNSPLLTTRFGDGAGILLAILAKGFLGLSIVAVVYRVAKASDRHWFVQTLSGEVNSGVLSQAELDSMLSIRRRRRFRRTSAGPARTIGHRQRLMVDLAGAIAGGDHARADTIRLALLPPPPLGATSAISQ